VNHLQKKLLGSTVSVLIQTLERTEKFLFSCLLHRLDIKLKYLLKNNIERKYLNKILFFSSVYKLLKYKFNSHKITGSYGLKWTPLIKANTTHSSAAYTSNYCTCNKVRINHRINCPELSEKHVLCIGGRSMLYTEYRCLIESLGGNLLIYRGNQKGDTDHLPTLLTCADMVICPVDCVNHETYFAVKYFCKKSGKPCALLDRSDLPTFRKGIETLIGIST
jgi:Uncharacterized protein conserved in bacteria (DUF2325)